MFVRYYCIKTNCDTWEFEIFEENEPVNLYCLRLKARGNGTFTACVLKKLLPGQIPTSWWRCVFTFATVHATDADVTFYDGPDMHTVKAAKQVYNSTWIALLKHVFVLVKTWLLITCGTGFYARITVASSVMLNVNLLTITVVFASLSVNVLNITVVVAALSVNLLTITVAAATFIISQPGIICTMLRNSFWWYFC